MEMRYKEKIQVFCGDGWKYIFCNNPNKGIITTENHKKALPQKARDLSVDMGFFKSKYADHKFRTVFVNGTGMIVEQVD